MSDTSDLTRRLIEDGIDPGLMRLPRCAGCAAPRQIVAYDGDRLQFGCRTAGCDLAHDARPQRMAQPSVTSVITVRATCDGCDDATDHQVAELSNGDTVIACNDCPTLVVLR